MENFVLIGDFEGCASLKKEFKIPKDEDEGILKKDKWTEDHIRKSEANA